MLVDFIAGLIAFGVVVLFLVSFLTGGKNQDEATSQGDAPPAVDPMAKTKAALKRVVEACRDASPCVQGLLLAASADGKVSRDELRTVMWVAESFGVQFALDDVRYIADINSGVRIRLVGEKDHGVSDIMADVANIDRRAVARVYAAYVAISKPWNKRSRASDDVLSALESNLRDQQKEPAPLA